MPEAVLDQLQLDFSEDNQLAAAGPSKLSESQQVELVKLVRDQGPEWATIG